MSREVKENIIQCGVISFVILIIIGTLIIVGRGVNSHLKKEENAQYKEIQSYTYIIIDGTSFKTSEIQSFEDKSGQYYKNYTFILEDGTKIETGSYILTNRRNLK